jgi:hypothetical protein
MGQIWTVDNTVEGVEVTHERGPSKGTLNRSTPGLHRFRYKCDDCFAYLTVRVDSRGGIRFRHDRLTINKKPSHGEIPRTREVMQRVELAISECGFGEDLASIEER